MDGIIAEPAVPELRRLPERNYRERGTQRKEKAGAELPHSKWGERRRGSAVPEK